MGSPSGFVKIDGSFMHSVIFVVSYLRKVVSMKYFYVKELSFCFKN